MLATSFLIRIAIAWVGKGAASNWASHDIQKKEVIMMTQFQEQIDYIQLLQ
jgi:hypothetical protein